MPRFLIGLCGVLLLLFLLVASAPARLLSAILPPGQVTMQGVSGTLWQGVSSRTVAAVEGGYLHLGRVAWSLSPGSLLLFSPRIDIDSQWGNQRIRGELVYNSRGSIDFTNVDALIPAALVQQFVPLELSGNFALLLPRLDVVDAEPRAGEGRIVWQDGAWVSPDGKRPLGSYAIDFQQLAGEPLVGEVVTLSGSLEAAGKVSLDGRNYAVDILLSGPGLDDPQLKQALQLVAIPEGDDFRVSLEGAF